MVAGPSASSPQPSIEGTPRRQAKLIAEPWDLGLYMVGTFPNWDVWKEWNGQYRDDIRRFIKCVVDEEEGGGGACMHRESETAMLPPPAVLPG